MSYKLKDYPFYDVSSNDPGTPLAQANPVPSAIISRFVVARYPSLSMAWAYRDVVADTYASTIVAESRRLGIRAGGYAYILQGGIEVQAQKFIDHSKQIGAYKDGKWQLE